MGTSASSKGPSSGVSFDPPWLDDEGGFEPNDPSDTQDIDVERESDAEAELEKNLPVAPARRFAYSKTLIGKYARDKTGRDGFEKAAGHYSKTGMGGAGNLANRMRHSTSTGARLAHFLGAVSSSESSAQEPWVRDILERNLQGSALVDAIVKQVAPSGGSRDEESCANSMADALSEFIDRNEDVDILNLGENEIRSITELFLANEACNRLTNDIGQIFESDDISPKESLSLLNEMREYLREDLAVQLEGLWEKSANPSQRELDTILREAVQRTFEIYEG